MASFVLCTHTEVFSIDIGIGGQICYETIQVLLETLANFHWHDLLRRDPLS